MMADGKIITHVYEDSITGLPILQDFTGKFHMLEKWSVTSREVGSRIYIQTLSHGRFPGTKDFYPIPNELTGEDFTRYAVPSDYFLEIAFIMASQDKLRGGGPGVRGPEMSLIGLFLDGYFTMTIPFKHDMHYVLFEPLRFSPSMEIEIKIRPCSRRTRVMILTGGYLVSQGEIYAQH